MGEDNEGEGNKIPRLRFAALGRHWSGEEERDGFPPVFTGVGYAWEQRRVRATIRVGPAGPGMDSRRCLYGVGYAQGMGSRLRGGRLFAGKTEGGEEYP